MSKYHMLKIYIKHKKHNFITLLISNKIMNTKIPQNDCTYIITLFFNNLYRCNLCQNHDKLYKLYKYYIKIVRISSNNFYHYNKKSKSR